MKESRQNPRLVKVFTGTRLGFKRKVGISLDRVANPIPTFLPMSLLEMNGVPIQMLFYFLFKLINVKDAIIIN